MWGGHAHWAQLGARPGEGCDQGFGQPQHDVGHVPANDKKTTKYWPIGASATQEPSVHDVLKT